jgi:putative heme transporter
MPNLDWQRLRQGSRRLSGALHRLERTKARAIPAEDRLPVATSTPVIVQSALEQSQELAPRSLRVAAAWAWRLLILAAVVAVVAWLAGRLAEVVIPLFAALLFTAALSSLNVRLRNLHWPDWAAAITSMLVMTLVVFGLFGLVGTQIAFQWGLLSSQAGEGINQVVTWLGNGPLHFGQDQIDIWARQLLATIEAQKASIAGKVAVAGITVAKFLTAGVMCAFATFFLLKDGRKISTAGLSLVPVNGRDATGRAIERGWNSLESYVGAAVTVAAADGIGSGIGALALGSELWLAITTLTFVCAFIPMIGGLMAGSVAVLVVLVTLGLAKAIIMLVVFVVVMEIEVHVLQPVLMGRAVSIHPLVVLVGIASGMILAGIVGALFAIPLIAFISGVIRGATEPTGIVACDITLDDDLDEVPTEPGTQILPAPVAQ